MSTPILVTFLHVGINKMAGEKQLRKTIPQICQSYIFMRVPCSASKEVAMVIQTDVYSNKELCVSKSASEHC